MDERNGPAPARDGATEESPATPGPRVLAHRGANRRWPEHSRAAYVQALDDGADGLECDVRLTADGVLVCWHDAVLDRTSDGAGPVHERTLEELRALRLRRRGHEPGPGTHRVLTLTELLELARAAGRPLELAVEIKHPNPFGRRTEDAVLELLLGAGWDPGSGRVDGVAVSFMAFDPGSLVHLAGPDGPARVLARDLVALTDELELPALLAEMAPGLGDDPAVVAEVERLVAQARALVDEGLVGRAGPSLAFLRARPETVRRWLAQGTDLRVWTVDEPDELALCRELGVAEVVTDVPRTLLALLGR